MGWRAWSKFCCGHKWILLFLSPLFLLFLTIFIMTFTLPLPAPHPDVDRWPSRALSSAREFKSRPRTSEPLPSAVFRQTINAIQGHAWESNHGMTENAAKNINDGKNTLESHVEKNKQRSMKEMGASARQLNSHASPHIPQFTGNSKRLKPRIKPGNRTEEMYIQTERGKSGAGHVLLMGETAMRKIYRIPESTKQALAANNDGKNHKTMSKDAQRLAHQKTDISICPSFKPQDVPESDSGRIRVSADRREVPWLSEDDVRKMKMLAEGEVVSKARVPAHGQVLQVALQGAAQQETSEKSPALSHGELCHTGHCSLVKRTDDWFEVLAFHLDRVLGLNRSLPAVLRSFHSEILPYRYIRGAPRPAVWWDPDIRHLEDSDNDQNSVPLSHAQYQRMLRARCGIETGLNEEPCVGVRHSEWGRLALFDFLLQVNDRLDRSCCGFRPDPADLCVENLLQSRCGNSRDLLLVHILVRKADPSRLVFIDNAGRPLQPLDNLNFRLIQDIDQFPERAVSVLQSGCLETLLLRSLYADREFWESRGGAGGLRPLIRALEERGRILVQRIRDRRLPLRD